MSGARNAASRPGVFTSWLAWGLVVAAMLTLDAAVLLLGFALWRLLS